MMMFDPLYIRPDDVGTQRNRALALTQTDSLPEVVEVTPRSGDRENTTTPVAGFKEERRSAKSHDRRRGERRKQMLPCLVDTRSHRERRSHSRRREDTETPVSIDQELVPQPRRGVDIVI